MTTLLKEEEAKADTHVYWSLGATDDCPVIAASFVGLTGAFNYTAWKPLTITVEASGAFLSSQFASEDARLDSFWDGGIRNRRSVLYVIERSPGLLRLLEEAQARLSALFPEGNLILEASYGGEQVALLVVTRLDVDTARARLEEFDREWWLPHTHLAKGNLYVALEFV